MKKCECGCGQDIFSDKRFLHGHHAKGRKKSDEEKRKIGEKNSVNMKRFYTDNPELAKAKSVEMRSFMTPETEEKRIAATKLAYELMTPEEKQKFSDHAHKQWTQNRETMLEGIAKVTAIQRQRYKDGYYDHTLRNEKISETVTQRYLDGGFEWSVGEYISTKTGKTCNYRSSWELQLMQQLDSDLNVVTWEFEFDKIKYQLNGKNKYYVPDFHITLLSEPYELLVEVKPERLRETEMNIAKKVVALDYCSRKKWAYSEWEPQDGKAFITINE
jgi:hypothetical protein